MMFALRFSPMIEMSVTPATRARGVSNKAARGIFSSMQQRGPLYFDGRKAHTRLFPAYRMPPRRRFRHARNPSIPAIQTP